MKSPSSSSGPSKNNKTPTRSVWDVIKSKQWLIVPLLSVLLYRCVNSNNQQQQQQQQPSTPTSDLVKNSRGGSPWKSFPGNFRLTPAFPDHASRYDLLSFMPATGDYDYIEIQGHFPFARYFGINLYDSDKATDFSGLADREMVPQARGGSRNPFVIIGQNNNVDNKNSIDLDHRRYTVWLVSESIAPRLRAERDTQHVNIITFPDGIKTLAFMNRVYRPNRGENLLGGVPLPTVEAFKLDHGSKATAPQLGKVKDALKTKLRWFLFNPTVLKTWDLMKEFAPPGDVRFNRVSDEGLFPNAHMEYIVAPIEQYYWNKVAVITMKKTPTFDDTFDGGNFREDVNVRYWSFCLGDLVGTGTPDCLCDDEIHKNPDGSSITIVIAPFYLKSKILEAGLNYLAWGLTYKPMLIHRHMLAAKNFTSQIGNVASIGRPPAVKDWNADFFERHSAEHWMGDYTPKGKIISVREFMMRLNQGEFRVAFD